MSYFVLCGEGGWCSRIRVRDANRIQDCCNRLNWGARDHASHAPPVTTTHVCFFSVVTRCAYIRVFIIPGANERDGASVLLLQMYIALVCTHTTLYGKPLSSANNVN